MSRHVHIVAVAARAPVVAASPSEKTNMPCDGADAPEPRATLLDPAALQPMPPARAQ